MSFALYDTAQQFRAVCDDLFSTYVDTGLLFYRHAAPDHLCFHVRKRKDYKLCREFFATMGDVVSYRDDGRTSTALRLHEPLSYTSPLDEQIYSLPYLKVAYAPAWDPTTDGLNRLVFTGVDFLPPVDIAMSHLPNFCFYYQRKSLEKHFKPHT